MVICCSVLVLSACGSKKTTDSTNNAVTTKASQSVVEEETGHPSGEVQKMYLYVMILYMNRNHQCLSIKIRQRQM